MTSRTINFDDLGSAEPSIQIPSGYAGFQWGAYDTASGQFTGDVFAETGGRAVTSGAYSVQGIGFEMKLLDNNLLFNVNNIVIAATGGAAEAGVPMDVTVTGYRGAEEKDSILFNTTVGPLRIDLNFSAIDRLRFFSNSSEVFDVDDITVTFVSPPNSPN